MRRSGTDLVRRTRRQSTASLACLLAVALASTVPACSSEPTAYRFDDHLDEAAVLTRFESRDGPAAAARTTFEFDDDPQGWSASDAFARPEVREGALVLDPARAAPGPADPALDTPQDARPEIRSPSLDLPLDRFRELELRMRVEGASSFRIAWDTRTPDGSIEPSAPNTSPRKSVRAGGGFVTYRISTLGMRGGPGSRLASLVVFFPREAAPRVEIDRVAFTSGRAGYLDRPLGPFQDSIGGVVRRGFFLRSPGAIAFEAARKGRARLLVGLGLLESSAEGVDFVVSVDEGGAEREILRERIRTSEEWHDVGVELPPATRERERFVFRIVSSRPGEVALWANPLLVEQPARPKRRPSAIVYLFDAMRADALGVLGRSPSVTPVLDGIAGEGAFFRRAYSTANWTRPAVASLFTSLHPEAHGVTEGEDRLPDAAVTIFEAARARGYLTAIFTTTPHAGSTINFQQGIDFLFEPSSVIGGTDIERLGKPSSDKLNEAFFRWLDGYGGSGLPFLAYLHSLDMHDPYWPPPTYGARLVPDYEGPGPEGRLPRRREAETDAARLRALYDAEVAFNDEEIGVLVDRLREKGRLGDTLLVFLADHGEEFGEHGRWGHGHHLMDVLLHIPLVVSWPGHVKAGRAIDTPVSIVDVAPTVLEMLGIESPPSFEGSSLASLVGARARGEFRPRPIFASFRSRQQAVIDGRWKLVRVGEKRSLLFDLEADPVERRNLAAADPERAARYRALLEEWRKDRGAIATELRGEEAAETRLDVEENEALRALGYAQ